MMKTSIHNVRRIIFVILAISLVLSNVANSDDGTEYKKLIDGTVIYLGVMPAELIQGHAKEHAEASMHDKNVTRKDSVHIIIALYNDRTGMRIEDAEVRATVAELGLGEKEKKLEAMEIDNTITYGNFFKMPSTDYYHIDIKVTLKSGKEMKTQFTHQHYK